MTKLDYRLQCALKDGEMQRAQFEARDLKAENERLTEDLDAVSILLDKSRMENERLRALLQTVLMWRDAMQGPGAPDAPVISDIRAALAAAKG